jgi:hypothetical protein
MELLPSASHLNYFDYEYPKNSNKAEAQSTIIDTVLSLLNIVRFCRLGQYKKPRIRIQGDSEE